MKLIFLLLSIITISSCSTNELIIKKENGEKFIIDKLNLKNQVYDVNDLIDYVSRTENNKIKKLIENQENDENLKKQIENNISLKISDELCAPIVRLLSSSPNRANAARGARQNPERTLLENPSRLTLNALVRRAAHRGRLAAVHAHDGAERLGPRLRACRPAAGASHARSEPEPGRPRGRLPRLDPARAAHARRACRRVLRRRGRAHRERLPAARLRPRVRCGHGRSGARVHGGRRRRQADQRRLPWLERGWRAAALRAHRCDRAAARVLRARRPHLPRHGRAARLRDAHLQEGGHSPATHPPLPPVPAVLEPKL